jgi:hypothetical protein
MERKESRNPDRVRDAALLTIVGLLGVASHKRRKAVYEARADWFRIRGRAWFMELTAGAIIFGLLWLALGRRAHQP